MNFKNDVRHTFVSAALILNASLAFADNDAVKEINELLRGELSAVETYNQALGKYGESSSATLLKSFRTDHEMAVAALKQEVVKHGGTPTTSSGPWGVWAQAVTGGAKLIGESSALKALKEGEEHGQKEYMEVLDDKDVPESCKDAVKAHLLPKQAEHIKDLDAQIAKVK